MNEFAKRVVLYLLRGYKWAISPMLGPACRYVPSCSEYAADAVTHYGVLRGGGMAFWRLLRCHPFAKGGYDPAIRVPRSNAPCRKEVPASRTQTLSATGR